MRRTSILAFTLLALSSPHASVARAPGSAAAEANGQCPINYYRNVSGRCVNRPVQSSTVPKGASARCRDGGYSFSQNRRGTCSYHGGVAQWP